MFLFYLFFNFSSSSSSSSSSSNSSSSSSSSSSKSLFYECKQDIMKNSRFVKVLNSYHLFCIPLVMMVWECSQSTFSYWGLWGGRGVANMSYNLEMCL